MLPRGVIFDLDGTLVDSALDFDLMRREMGIQGRRPILETLNSLDPAEAERMWAIVAEHELRGVERATLFPGAREFLAELTRRGIKRAIVTRNSRASTLATLARLAIDVDAIISRDDAPAKPAPEGILRICQRWNTPPGQCVMVGDYYFDIQAGQRAGTRTVLFTGAGKPHDMPEGFAADFVLPCFTESAAFWSWIEAI